MPIAFSGHASDAQDGTLAPSRLTWSVVLNHCPSNCHAHPLQDFAGVASGSLPAPDHEYPSSLTLVLTATDSAGASASTSLRLDPRTVDLTFATNPTGLGLTVGAEAVTAPVTRTVIVGSSNSVSAPAAGRRRHALRLRGLVGRGRGDPQRRRARHAHDLHGDVPARQVGCPATPSHAYTIPAPTGPPAATPLPGGGIAFSTLGSDRSDLRGLHRHRG